LSRKERKRLRREAAQPSVSQEEQKQVVVSGPDRETSSEAETPRSPSGKGRDAHSTSAPKAETEGSNESDDAEVEMVSRIRENGERETA
ncbi:hypothetical protein FRC09_013917, partial [Ceratobasidium sp. 395]